MLVKPNFFFLATAHEVTSNVTKFMINGRKKIGSRLFTRTIRRRRKNVRQIHCELGKTIFRRSFRMTLMLIPTWGRVRNK